MKQDTHNAEHLERVIEKNQQYLDTVADNLLKACLGADSTKDVPAAVIENVLKVYGGMRKRLAEIEVVQTLLLRRYNKRIPDNPLRQKLIAELDAQIKALSALRGNNSSPEADVGTDATASSPPADHPASDRWLRIEQDSLSFTINARLLDELEYEAPVKPGESVRVVQASGRSFTLFNLRGPASALDALHPRIKLRQHDIIERFSAQEIRGVLTHLRRTSTNDVKHIFQQLLTSQYSDVKCILVGLHSPDQMNDHFLKYLDWMIEKMQPGDLRTIEIADHDW